MQSIPIKVVSIAIIKNLRRNLCDQSKRENKKVVTYGFEPSTRQRWYASYSAGPTPAVTKSEKISITNLRHIWRINWMTVNANHSKLSVV